MPPSSRVLNPLKMNIPKPTKEDKQLFASLAPKDSRVSTKLVFGNDAAFVNGNMFFGIYGKEIFVRLPEDKAKELLREKGSGAFEPMPGHPMSGYFIVPRTWRNKPSELRKWVAKSLEWTSTLPAKKSRR
jgi:TfoX/Sxy family transcriptional regulator of competence genes